MFGKIAAKLTRHTALAVALPVAVWLAICAEWPWRLGFFSDDWLVLMHPAPGSADAFSDVMALVSNRPASAPFIWAVQAFVDWSPVRAQIANGLAFALAALSIALLARRLALCTGVAAGGGLIAASIAGAAYLAMPSNIGIFAWNVGMMAAAPALIPFCLGMTLLLEAEGRWNARSALAMLLLLISHLSYEAFYFQEITILLLAMVLRGRKPDLAALQTFGAVAAINVLCIAYNRLAPGYINKSFNANWWATFTGGYGRLDQFLATATAEYATFIAAALVATIVLGMFGLIRLIGVARAHASIGILICGIVAAGILYAMAGYGLVLEGIMARTSVCISFYMTLGLALLAVGAWHLQTRGILLHSAAIAACVLLISGLTLASRARVDEWAETWRLDATRLATLPDAYAYNPADQRIFVLVDQTETGDIPLASAPWEIHSAIAYQVFVRSGHTDRRMMKTAWRNKEWKWFAATKGWFNRWDGKVLAQGFCSNKVELYHNSGSELLVWTLGNPQLTPAAPGWSVGCEG
ncbi:MAG: hypothetical protein ACRCS9_06885 [Hyphomicrobium sp.]